MKIIPCFLLALCFLRTDAQYIYQRVDSIFSDINNNVPGYVIAIVKEGKVLIAKGYGLSSLEHRIPLDEKSVFHLASVSKQFTAFAILLLEQMGKLSIDDEIHQYLPGLPKYDYPVTIKNLLYHTSGIRDQWQLWGLLGISEPDLITQKNALDMIYRVKGLNFKPNDEFLYSNSGYTLLAEIVEKVSGKRFNDFCTTYIFSPLVMPDTRVFDDQGLIVNNRVSSYEGGKPGFTRSELNFTTYGATSLFSTAADLVNWMDNFRTRKVGGDQLFEKFLTKGKLNNGESFGYGMGIFVGDYKNHPYFQHGGTDAGFQTFVTYFPEEKLGIVVLSNFSDGGPFSKAMKIADLFLPEQQTMQVAESKKKRTVVPFQKKYLPFYEGKYETYFDQLIEIKATGPVLTIQFPERGHPDTLEAVNDSLFAIKSGGEIQFQTKENKPFAQFSYKNGLDFYDAKKVVYKLTYTKEERSEFAGTYFSDELQTAYKVSVQHDSLHISHIRNGTMNMMPRVQDRFAVKKWFMRFLRFTRNSQHAVNGFLVETSRNRDVYFSKLPGR